MYIPHGKARSTKKKPVIVDVGFVGHAVTCVPTKSGNGAHVYVDKNWVGKTVWVILPKESVIK